MSLGSVSAVATASSSPYPAGDPTWDGHPTPSVAVLAGRPDLSEAVVIEAIRERLAFDGRTGPTPEVVAEAARLGKRKALAYLRKLVLPAPKARLAMPVQPILRSHGTAHAGLPSPAVPAGR